MIFKKSFKFATYFLAGAVSVLAFLILTGASTSKIVGKYEIEVIVRDRITQIYVVDTTTGAVKWVDAMNTPFEKLKGN